MSAFTYPAARRPRRPTYGRRISKVTSSSAERFDLVVIGCGPAGEKGANQAAYSATTWPWSSVDRGRSSGWERRHRSRCRV